MKKILNALLVSAASLSLAACSSHPQKLNTAADNKYLASGTIVLSRSIDQTALANTKLANQKMVPLIGFFPPSNKFAPAHNEPWLSISKSSGLVSLMVGDRAQKEFRAPQKLAINTGVYAIQRKDRNPRWYAPDDYFSRRRLTVPAASDPLRYRRGALGPLAIYLNQALPIHSALIQADEVGGIHLDNGAVEELFASLPLGSTIVIKN